MSKKKRGLKKPYNEKKDLKIEDVEDIGDNDDSDFTDFEDVDDIDSEESGDFEDLEDEDSEDFEDIEDGDSEDFDDIEEEDFEDPDDNDGEDPEDFDDIDDMEEDGFEDIGSIDENTAAASALNPADPDEYTDSDFDGEEAEQAGEAVGAQNVVQKYDPDDYTEEDFESVEEETEVEEEKPKKNIGGLIWRIGLVFLGLVVVFAVWTVGTESGRKFGLSLVARFIHENAGKEEDPDFTPIPVDPDDPTPTAEADPVNPNITEMPEITDPATGKVIEVRSEDYVKSYLLFGIEEIDGAANTDAILLISVNSKDSTIKMTSILRDTYVNIPGHYANKINAVYSMGARGATTRAEAHKNGAELLVKVIEETFKIKISGWACVNFNSFEYIVNRLGGIDIELGEAEAKYLNKTNYISNPEYRNVSPGWNHLNGNQVLGYCRVRKKETLGGANNDYGRTVRHRRVINAIIKKYTSSGITELLPILRDILAYVYTDLSEDELTDVMSMIVENKIYNTQSLRIPIDGTFYDSGEKGIDNGYRQVTWTLVMGDELSENIKKLYQFVFLDEEENANGGN
ncbi:MAG: LCP family protein [Lachnospiraceae bacterium]|nr:LCP family protein [Lachnospiraceae bacterium]